MTMRRGVGFVASVPATQWSCSSGKITRGGTEAQRYLELPPTIRAYTAATQSNRQLLESDVGP